MRRANLDHDGDTLDFENVRQFSKSPNEHFDIKHLDSCEPFGQFKCWFDEVIRLQLEEARTFTLATATKDGLPSCRPLRLVDIIDGKGFTFFTNCDSRKGTELEENPHAAMSFWWASTARSIRIEGKVKKLSSAESDAYFSTLPVEMQLATVVNLECQRIIPNRQYVNNIKQKYNGQTQFQRPDRWTGFLLVPHIFEFFQRQHDWMSDRVRFRQLPITNNASTVNIDENLTHRDDNGWVIEQLAA